MYKKFTLLAMAVLLISIIPTTLKAASEWDNAVTIYGAALENDEDLRSETSGLLEAEDNDETGYVYSEDVDNYLGMLYDNSVLKSSIRIIQRDPGYGLNITLNESMGEITKITEETYQNALLTSGITDADVTIAAAEDVTGESALQVYTKHMKYGARKSLKNGPRMHRKNSKPLQIYQKKTVMLTDFHKFS